MGERNRDKSMNDTLFVLSLISAIFLPAQFVTGLYGMNFQDKDGTPTMPELLWEAGYEYFWILQLFLAVMMVLLVIMLRCGNSVSRCLDERCCCCRCCRRRNSGKNTRVHNDDVATSCTIERNADS